MRAARDAHTGECVALKIVEREARARLGAPRPKPGIHITDEKVLREIAVLKKCRHKNIVQLREVIDDPHSRKIFMVLEYMDDGEVIWRDAMNRPTLTVNEARAALRDVVLGLEYLHYLGIVHRDIKPANLLWDANHTVKISDFGVSYLCAAQRGEDGARDEVELSKTAGSPAFFAPELCVAGEDGTCPPITRAIDVWALGITLYCLLFGEPPFTADSEFTLFAVIPSADYALPEFMGADRVRVGPRAPRWTCGDEPPPSAPDAPESSLSHDALLLRDLLDRLLEKDPRRRITLSEVKKHPWMTHTMHDAKEWLERTDPSQHPSVTVNPQEVEKALTGFSRFKQQIRRLQTILSGTLHRGRHHSGANALDGAHSDGTTTPRYPLFGNAVDQTGPMSGIASAPANVLSFISRRGSGASSGSSILSRASSITTAPTPLASVQERSLQASQNLQAGTSKDSFPSNPEPAGANAPAYALGAHTSPSAFPPAVPVRDADVDADDISDLSDTSEASAQLSSRALGQRWAWRKSQSQNSVETSDESEVGINFNVRRR